MRIILVSSLLLLSTASCGNSKEAVAGLSVAVDGYCQCIAKVEALPAQTIAKVELLELETQECGKALDLVKVAQKEIKDHGDPAIQEIRKKQQGCFYRIRDLHKEARSSLGN